MSVILRKKPLAGGKVRLFLDIHTEAGREKEYLKFFLYDKPKTAAEREHNREFEKLASAIRAQRELQLLSSDHGLESGIKRKLNFLEYYQTYYLMLRGTSRLKDKSDLYAL
jgi:hypothetical protein